MPTNVKRFGSGGDRDLSLQDVQQTYNRGTRATARIRMSSFSDPATEPQNGLPTLHECIHREVIKSGHGSLDDGDREPTGGGNRTSRFQAASNPVFRSLIARRSLKSESVFQSGAYLLFANIRLQNPLHR
jgi:hypothetical protein